MSQIEITEENKEMYQTYYQIKSKKVKIKNLALLGIHAILNAIMITVWLFVGMFAVGNIGSKIHKFLTPIISSEKVVNMIAMFTGIGCFFGPTLWIYDKFVPNTFLYKFNSLMTWKEFKKQYPNFDTHTPVKDVEIALNQYEQDKITSFEVTKENQEIYKEYIMAREGSIVYIDDIIYAMIEVLLTVVVIAIGGTLLNSLNSIFLAIDATILGTFLSLNQLGILEDDCSKKSFKRFQKKYPNFDTTLDVSIIRQLLKEYQLSQKLKEPMEDFTKQEDTEMIVNQHPLSSQQQLELLKKEREFWLAEKQEDLEKNKVKIMENHRN